MKHSICLFSGKISCIHEFPLSWRRLGDNTWKSLWNAFNKYGARLTVSNHWTEMWSQIITDDRKLATRDCQHWLSLQIYFLAQRKRCFTAAQLRNCEEPSIYMTPCNSFKFNFHAIKSFWPELLQPWSELFVEAWNWQLHDNDFLMSRGCLLL